MQNFGKIIVKINMFCEKIFKGYKLLFNVIIRLIVKF